MLLSVLAITSCSNNEGEQATGFKRTSEVTIVTSKKGTNY